MYLLHKLTQLNPVIFTKFHKRLLGEKIGGIFGDNLSGFMCLNLSSATGRFPRPQEKRDEGAREAQGRGDKTRDCSASVWGRRSSRRGKGRGAEGARARQGRMAQNQNKENRKSRGRNEVMFAGLKSLHRQGNPPSCKKREVGQWEAITAYKKRRR